MDYRSLLNSVARPFRSTIPSPSPSVVRDLDETRTPIRSRLFTRQSRVKIPTIFPKFKDHYVSNRREFQEPKPVTGRTIMLQKNKRKQTVGLVAITTAFKRQALVAAGSSSKALQPLPPTVLKDEDALDTEVPSDHVELNEDGHIPHRLSAAA